MRGRPIVRGYAVIGGWLPSPRKGWGSIETENGFIGDFGP